VTFLEIEFLSLVLFNSWQCYFVAWWNSPTNDGVQQFISRTAPRGKLGRLGSRPRHKQPAK
jgi:hypothetical protein